MAMKITHVISDGQIGGAGILLAHITDALAEEFETEILLPRGSALRGRLPARRVRIRELPFRADESFCPRDVPLFCRYFAETKPDIVHTHAALSARVGATLAGVPVRLSTRHCAVGRAEKKPAWYQWVYDRVTTLTISTAAAATENLRAEGVDMRRVVTILNGVPPLPRAGTEEKRARLSALGFRENDFIVGCCGRLEPVKGQDLLLRAVAALTETNPRLKVLLVGDGTQARTLPVLADTLGITEAVRLTGYVSAPDIYQNLFSLNINASRGTETSCLAISECMSLGIPTLASDFGGNREMIRPGVNGLLFPRDNAFALAAGIERLMISPALLKQLGEGAAETFRDRFSVERMASEYAALYHSFDPSVRANGGNSGY